MSSVIRSLVVKVGADTKEFQTEMKNISKDLGKAGKKISQAGKNMTLGVTVPAVAAGAAAFKMAAEMEDAMGAADQIFGKSADNMKSWAKGLESYYGIATGEAVEYGNMMGSMLQNIGGLTEDEAASQSQTLIKLAGDLTAMYGGTTQDAVRALTGALKGNNTMLDNYGMAVNDSMIKTKALEMGLYDGTGQMDLATKQAATLALIMEQSGAAQGQAAREAEGASGSMRALMTEVKNLGTTMGTVLLPIITPIISKIKEMVEKFGSLDEGTKKNIVTFVALAAVVGPITSGIGGLVSGVGSAIGTFGKFSKAISGGSSVLSAMGTLIGPGGVVLLAVAAFAAAAYLIITNWDEISGFFKGLWDGILNLFNGFKEKFIGGWTKITDTVKGAIGKVKEFFGMDSPEAAPVYKKANNTNTNVRARGYTQYAQGTNYVPHDGFAYLHKGEAVVPAKYNNGGKLQSDNKSRQTTVNLNVGTLIADDYGLKQLERKLKDIRVSENTRLGGAPV